MRTFVFGMLGITLAGIGCSDVPTDAPPGGDDSGGSAGTPSGGSAGSGAGVTGGTATGGAATGGSTSTGGSVTGGTPGTGGTQAGTGGGGGDSGGSSGTGTGGAATGGAGTGGASTGGSGVGGAGTGNGGTAGTSNGGAGKGGASMGGAGGKGGSSGGGGKAGSTGSGGGTCTASQNSGKSTSGTGPHDVVIETNSAQGIRCGTIYRPADLSGAEKFPIFVWGEGGCSQNGSSNQAAMNEIASWGYFVVADGTPGGTNACTGGQSGQAFLDYITWAIAENGKACSAYYQKLETTKIAADGFSCGGLMAENVSGDPRFTAIGITSSGLMGANATLYGRIHTPFKIMNGGSSDIAYQNGLRDYQQISALGKPVIYFSKSSAGHGGDLNQGRGDFNRVNLAWLNWQLKGDMGATGKGFLMGSTCMFCTDAGWDYMAANIQ